MNYINAIFLMLLLYPSLSSAKKIIINDVEWPPYFFIGEKTVEQGIGKEIINLCFKRADFEGEYFRLPIKRTSQYMQKGEIDVTVYSYKKQREEFLLYSKEPLFSVEYVFMVRADSTIKINRLEDLNEYRIGYLAGLSYTPELMKIIEAKSKIKQSFIVYNLSSMFMKLLAKKPHFDLITDAKSTLYWQAKNLAISEYVKILPYSIKTKKYYLTVSKKSKNISDPKQFLLGIDRCLIDLKASGKYHEILMRYGSLE